MWFLSVQIAIVVNERLATGSPAIKETSIGPRIAE